jgi:hypothetical protein
MLRPALRGRRACRHPRRAPRFARGKGASSQKRIHLRTDLRLWTCPPGRRRPSQSPNVDCETWVGAFDGALAHPVAGSHSGDGALAALLEFVVVEVNQPHAHSRRRRGKSDAVDAELAARRYLTGEGIAVAKDTSGVVESIRMLRVARHGAVKARTAALLPARDLITTAPQPLREQITVRKTLRARLAICKRFPTRAAQHPHSRGQARAQTARRSRRRA